MYVTRIFNTEEAAGGLEDKSVHNESKPQFMCRTASQFHYNWQREYGAGTEQQAVWRVTGFWSGTVNMHGLTGSIVDCGM